MAKELQIGHTYGGWTVLEKLDYAQKYRCECICGTKKNIRVYDLINGKSLFCKSCSSSVSRSGGYEPLGQSSEYNIWVHINQRCHNPKNKDYPNYGGRGIVVCDIWRESFEAFLLIMGTKPDPGDTIDRIDYNGNYEPGNCRWLSKAEQTRNKRDNVRVTAFGETMVASLWSRDPRCVVSQATLYKRLKRDWDPERALTEPVKEKTK